jgi:hypothetical protein
MRVMARVLSVFALAVLLPGLAYAQASIAGVVRDTSGAVLPGVTVEAASPVLIEKVRTVVTDGAGQYRIIDLRPGTYTVTFTLPGFNTVKREGVELAGDAVANVVAEMRVGALEETITVTGSAPVVDVQSTRGQQVLDREVLRDIPTSRQYYSVATLIPGVTVTNQTQDVGGSALLGTPDYQIHGGRPGDGRLMVDGLSVGSARSAGANRSMYAVNVGIAQETAISTSGGLGEAETGGMVINAIPREGGNTFRGTFYTSYANGAMQGSNFTDELRARGLPAANELKKVWEVTPTIGGPILQDKLWFLVGGRHQGTRNTIAGMFHNLNAGDITKWTYEPDLSRQATEDGTWKSVSLRLTYQLNAKNKFNVFWDEQKRRVGYLGGGNTTTSPEGQALQFGYPNRVGQLTWSSPQTNRVLIEAATALHKLQWSGKERPGYNRDMIRVQEQAGIIPGISYRGYDWASNWSGTYPIRASISYVTGSHTAKVGMLRTWYTTDDRGFSAQGISYRFNNGVPNQLTLSNLPRRLLEEHTTLGVYAQDSWVLGRLTLQGGVRWDKMTQVFPEQIVGFTRFIPNGFVVEESTGVDWNDVTPRFAAAYDLMGDGRTAVKFTIGKYMVAQDGGGIFGSNLNPIQRLATSTNRAWNDADRDFVPDCDLLNPATNGECGPYSNQAFGREVYQTFYDQDLIAGYGVRPYNWEFSTSVQRELLPRVGVNVGYFRRWYGNFVTTDNRAVTAADFNSFSVPIPNDSRLPAAGSTLTGLYNVSPTRFGVVDEIITTATTFGDQEEWWHGVDLNVNIRQFSGLTFSGGLSTGRRTEDSCALRDQLPELSPTNPYCFTREPWLTQYKWLASYLIPRIEVAISGTFQSAPGPQLAANFNVPNAQIVPSLGRPLSGNAANVSVNLVEPGTLYGDRSNQFDLRFAKVLSYGRTRANIGVDLYNALNANPITSYNQTFGANWLRPQAIMPARFLKFSLQLDW